MKTFKTKLYYLLLLKILPFSCFLIPHNTLIQLNAFKEGEKRQRD